MMGHALASVIEMSSLVFCTYRVSLVASILPHQVWYISIGITKICITFCTVNLCFFCARDFEKGLREMKQKKLFPERARILID